MDKQTVLKKIRWYTTGMRLFEPGSSDLLECSSKRAELQVRALLDYGATKAEVREASGLGAPYGFDVYVADDPIAGAKALQMLVEHGWVDGSHHKQYAMDRAARALTGDRYDAWVEYCSREQIIEWDTGTPT